MKDITRAVTPRDLADLLTSARTATVAWNNAGEIAAEPVAFRYANGEYTFGLPPGKLPAGTEVSLVIDEGPMYFDLRGVRVRGPASGAKVPNAGSLEWFEVTPEREVAWHYGTLRQR